MRIYKWKLSRKKLFYDYILDSFGYSNYGEKLILGIGENLYYNEFS